MIRCTTLIACATIGWFVTTTGLASSGEIIYRDGLNLHRANLDGSNPVNLGIPAGGALAIDTTHGLIFSAATATGSLTHAIFRANYDGSDVTQILSGDVFGNAFPRDMDVDPVERKVYWTATGKVIRANYDGSAVETVFNDIDIRTPWEIEIDPTHRKLYWVVSGLEKTIERSNLDGTGKEPVLAYFSSEASSFDLDPTHNHIYYTTSDLRGSPFLSMLNRAELDGSNNEVLIESFNIHDRNTRIVVDVLNGYVYDNARRRVALDGSSDTLTGISSTLQFAIAVPVPEPSGGFSGVVLFAAMFCRRLRKKSRLRCEIQNT